METESPTVLRKIKRTRHQRAADLVRRRGGIACHEPLAP
jgi:hypothetical protein